MDRQKEDKTIDQMLPQVREEAVTVPTAAEMKSITFKMEQDESEQMIEYKESSSFEKVFCFLRKDQ